MRLEVRNPRGEVTLVASLIDGRVEFDGGADYWESLVVLEPGTLERLTVQDGERYLRALVYEFRTPYAVPVLVE